MRASLLAALALRLAVTAAAQAPNPCALGRAEGTLRGLNVQAQLFNTGGLFFGGTTTNGDGYLVPLHGEDAGKSPLFAASLWVGGVVEGEVRATQARYANFRYRPGLTGRDGTPPTPAECTAADRVWVVSREDVAAYQRTGIPTDDLADWPVALGAPVLDGDGIAGNYALAGGDQPALRGDAMAFWAMTDLAAAPIPSLPPPLGLDVTAEAFAFQSGIPALATTTAYRFTVTNRNAAAIEDAYVGLYLDPDLGHPSDDYLGTDTTLAMSYVYNSDDEDEGSTGYGIPPAFGVMVIESPAGADGQPLGLTAAPSPVSRLCPNCTSGDLDDTRATYNSLRGLLLSGLPMRARGDGAFQPDSVSVTPFLYPGDPVTGQAWSEVNNGTTMPVNAPGDRRALVSTGPVRLAPGESATVMYALVFAQGSDRFDSVRALRQRGATIQSIAATDAFAPRPVEGTLVPRVRTLQVRPPAPNPFVDTARLTLLDLDGLDVRVRILDMLGREVQRLDIVPTRRSEPVEIGAGLAPGVYVVRVAGDAFEATLTIAKAR